MVLDVLPNGIRHQVAYRATLSDSTADIRARNLNQRGISEQDPAMQTRGKLSILRTGTPERDQRNATQNLIGLTPAGKALQTVGADDELKIDARVFLLQIPKRLDGVRDTRPLDLDFGEGESWISGYAQGCHVEPVACGCELRRLLQRVLPAGYPEDRVQRKLIADGLGDNEMPDVRRIERAAEDSNSPAFRAESRHRLRRD